MQPRRTIYPGPAIDWMVPGHRRQVLDVGSGTGAFAGMIAEVGHRVCCVDSDSQQVRRLARRMPGALPAVAQAEALPFASGTFDVVTVQESLSRFAPGLALAEFARVLHSVRHPKEAADVLVQAALRTGGRDNVTLIVADVVAAENRLVSPDGARGA